MMIIIVGWGCDTFVRQHPNLEIDLDSACVCVACVRAKLCARDDSAVARGGRMEFVGWSGRPAIRPSGSRGPGAFSLVLAWVFVRMFN